MPLASWPPLLASASAQPVPWIEVVIGLVGGLALFLFGMDQMTTALKGAAGGGMRAVLGRFTSNRFAGVVTGTVVTAVTQSSSVTTVLLVGFVSAGLMTLQQSVGVIMGANVGSTFTAQIIAFGANIGTCATALLATIGKPRAALRAAAVHILFNVVGVAVWLPFVGRLAGWVAAVSDDPARQIANAHTLFNVVNVALFVGFTGPIAVAVSRLVPIRVAAEDDASRPLYLDAAVLSTPALALDRVRMELGRMGRALLEMLDTAAPVVGRGTEAQLAKVEAADQHPDALHGHVADYLASLGRIRLSRNEERRLADLLAIANYLENMGDAIERNMVAIGRQRISTGVVISQATGQKLGLLYATVREAIEDLVVAIEDDTPERAMRVVKMKSHVRDHAHAVVNHLGTRLIADEPNRVASYRIEQEITEQLRRLYYFARHAAWHVVGRAEDHQDHGEE